MAYGKSEKPRRTSFKNEGITKLVIPEGVTEIGISEYRQCSTLTSVVIPGSVKKIGACAFEDCENLRSVVIAEGVTEIGNQAFSGCGHLTGITIPGSVKTIGKRAFAGCTNLKELILEEGVQKMEFEAFKRCRSLTSVTIPQSMTSIGCGAFCECGSLASVTIPETVTSIEVSAFHSCTSLKHLTIPKSVTSIGRAAFFHTRMEHMTLYDVVLEPPMLGMDEMRDAMEMLRTRDFSADLPENIRFAAITGYYLKTNDAQAKAFLRENAPAVMLFLMECGNERIICRLLEDEKMLTLENMEIVLERAAEKGSAELSAALLHYKSEVLGYAAPEEQFRL